MDHVRRDASHHPVRTIAWIVVIAGASLGFSLGFACATPFAALAAGAGARLGRREAISALLLAWIGNQAVGYLIHHYPTTWDSFAWGGAIGLAGIASVFAAGFVSGLATRPMTRIASAFTAAVAAYEATLFAASFVLPSEGNAFAISVLLRILEVNLVAYAGLLVLHRLAVGTGLLAPHASERPALA